MAFIKGYKPGVLSKSQLLSLCERKIIDNVKDPDDACTLSAIDLCLSDEAYEMVKGSVKPFGPRYNTCLGEDSHFSKKLDPDGNGIFTLEHAKNYVFKLQERLQLDSPGSAPYELYGQATAKSTIGRVDVLARLIVDGMDCYEYFEPKRVSGDLYLEITPITFDVRVKKGISLSQLRVFYGPPEYSEIKQNEIIYYSDNLLTKKDKTNGDKQGNILSVDTSPISVKNLQASAFCAKVSVQNVGLPAVDLWQNDGAIKPDPCQYWRLIEADKHNRVTIEKGAFYILRSREKIALPSSVAVYCRAMDETIGEMRIHYAGFVHPLFGINRCDKDEGTPLIFEVRGHNVNVSLIDGERMARLSFYRMSEDIQGGSSEYNEQTLKLSKLFREWPENMKKNEDGSVQELAN